MGQTNEDTTGTGSFSSVGPRGISSQPGNETRGEGAVSALRRARRSPVVRIPGSRNAACSQKLPWMLPDQPDSDPFSSRERSRGVLRAGRTLPSSVGDSPELRIRGQERNPTSTGEVGSAGRRALRQSSASCEGLGALRVDTHPEPVQLA